MDAYDEKGLTLLSLLEVLRKAFRLEPTSIYKSSTSTVGENDDDNNNNKNNGSSSEEK